MIFKNKIFTVVFFFVHINASYVSIELSGGRMGDCLMGVMYTLWAAFKTGANAAYNPFPYADRFVFSQKLTCVPDISDYKMVYSRELSFVNKNKNRHYIFPYFSQVYQERRYPWNNWINMDIDWEHPEFRKLLKSMIVPINNLNLVQSPKNCTTVAIHWRRGGKYEGETILFGEINNTANADQYIDYIFGLKFPPKEFYVDSLDKLSNFLEKKPLYVYLFTDDHNPKMLVDYLKDSLLAHDNITFDYRQANNSENNNVVEDFFSLLNFDCIIHSLSSFSIAASKIGDFKIDIYPEEQHWEGNKSIIDLTRWVMRNI